MDDKLREALNSVGFDKTAQDVVSPYGISTGLLQTIAFHVHRVLEERGYVVISKKELS